jgi:uncharacterized membrane protein required for colicin V production
MVQLTAVLWVGAMFFAFVGYSRGVSKELISMAGIILGLFALHQFDSLVRGIILANLPPDQRFYGQTIFFLVIVFFAYQTRALIGSEATQARRGTGAEGRDNLQSSVLGGIVGFVNGYLIMGSLWYFLDINRFPQTNLYPLNPYVVAPLPGSAGAAAVSNLPLYLLAGGPGGSGDLLALAVIVLFLIVLVVI